MMAVCVHVLPCMLAHYVEWHLPQAWAPCLFEDEQPGRHEHDSPGRALGAGPAKGSPQADRWDGRWRCEVRDGAFRHPGSDEEILVYSVKPAKVLAFGRGTFSHTSHRS